MQFLDLYDRVTFFGRYSSRNEMSVTKIASSQKVFIFLSPERAATYQPRATPGQRPG
jgi:hypothetical protein